MIGSDERTLPSYLKGLAHKSEVMIHSWAPGLPSNHFDWLAILLHSVWQQSGLGLSDFFPTHSFGASFALGTGSIELTTGDSDNFLLVLVIVVFGRDSHHMPPKLAEHLTLFPFVLISVHICSVGQCSMTISPSSTFSFL